MLRITPIHALAALIVTAGVYAHTHAQHDLHASGHAAERLLVSASHTHLHTTMTHVCRAGHRHLASWHVTASIGHVIAEASPLN